MSGILTQSTSDDINNILFGNICNDQDITSNFPICSSFANGMAQKGLCSIISYFLVEIRTVENDYITSNSGSKVSLFFNSIEQYEASKITLMIF